MNATTLLGGAHVVMPKFDAQSVLQTVESEDVNWLFGVPTMYQQLLRQSDLLTLHCPATAQTRGLINRESLARMKPGALLINVGRGSLVDTPALVEALAVGGARRRPSLDASPASDEPLVALYRSLSPSSSRVPAARRGGARRSREAS